METLERLFKSLLSSITVILLYYLATYGLISWLWPSIVVYKGEKYVNKDLNIDKSIFVVICLLLTTFLIIVITYHIFSHSVVNIIYNAIIIFHAIYLATGISIYVLKG